MPAPVSVDTAEQPTKSSEPPARKKGKKRAEEVKKELRSLVRGDDAPPAPAVDLKKVYLRIGAVLAVVWVIALIVGNKIAYGTAAGLTAAAVALAVWLDRYVKKTQALGALLQGADTAEGRKEALRRLQTDFKKSDSQAVLARAQLEMQDDPRTALATLESLNLDKELAPVAAQVRAMRAMIHLTLGEASEARALADKLELGKQQEPKTRAMFAAVASEAWARTGQGKKALATLELYNPDDAELGEVRAQMWRSRVFAHASQSDAKGVSRALKKLADINPHLIGMFVGQKKVHPLIEKEAKQLVMRLGVVPKKMTVKRM